MADKIFDSGVLPEISVTDTTPLPTINGNGLWTKITGLGIKNYLSSSFEALSNKSTSVTTDQASDTKYPSVKSVYDWVTGAFAKYSGDADFYQYSIVRTVASGNLTVSLKNFEGNDPTPTKPVKINIGGVVRTITSALSFTTSAGLNTFNSGGTELATKEVDYFVYLAYSTVSNSVIMAQSRIPYIMTQSDGDVTTPTNEKFINRSASANSTDSFVNIGRFNAIISAGGAYTWSIPATSSIVNSYSANTRYMDSTITFGDLGAMTISDLGDARRYSRYSIRGNTLTYNFASVITIGGTLQSSFSIPLPFSSRDVRISGISGSLGAGDFGYVSSDDTKTKIYIRTYNNAAFPSGAQWFTGSITYEI